MAHTITSAELSRDETAWAWIGHNVEEIGLAAAKIIEQNEKFGDSTSPAEAAVSLAHFADTKTNFFGWFNNDGVGEPKDSDGKIDKFDRSKGWRARRFGNVMKFFTSGSGYASSHVHDFDWEVLGHATVVDVCRILKTSDSANFTCRWVGPVVIWLSNLLQNNQISR